MLKYLYRTCPKWKDYLGVVVRETLERMSDIQLDSLHGLWVSFGTPMESISSLSFNDLQLRAVTRRLNPLIFDAPKPDIRPPQPSSVGKQISAGGAPIRTPYKSRYE